MSRNLPVSGATPKETDRMIDQTCATRPAIRKPSRSTLIECTRPRLARLGLPGAWITKPETSPYFGGCDAVGGIGGLRLVRVRPHLARAYINSASGVMAILTKNKSILPGKFFNS